jgi:hypothetical protein
MVTFSASAAELSIQRNWRVRAFQNASAARSRSWLVAT